MLLRNPLVLLAAMALAASPAYAADPEPEPAQAPAAASPLAAARGHIQGQRWGAAIAELQRVQAAGDADWNNLMGYALRKQTPPDLAGAQRHYDAALRIDPRHTGALEYAGELALMRKDLATAEMHLAALERICKSPCEPLDDLKAAVARYKAGAGKP